MGTAAGGPTGTGLLWTYTIKAKDGVNGTSALTLSDVVVSDANSAVIGGVKVNNGEVKVDVNAVAAAGSPTPGAAVRVARAALAGLWLRPAAVRRDHPPP
jgi:hypothetical protein